MTPAFVLDASVVMAWCFQDEATPATHKLLHRMAKEAAAVPSLLFLEVTNVLALSERKKRIDRQRADEFVTMLTSLDLDIDDEAHNRAFMHVLELCRSYGLTAYDALYLDLAMRRNLPLATLDLSLRAAAEKAGIKVVGT